MCNQRAHFQTIHAAERDIGPILGLPRRKKRGSLLKLSSSSVLLVPGLMYLKGAINADSILTFSGGETRDRQSQQEGSGRGVLMVLSIKVRDHHMENK